MAGSSSAADLAPQPRDDRRGTAAGAAMPYQEVTSKSGTPASCRVGSSGMVLARCAVETASARSSPPSTCCRLAGALSMANSTSPFITAAMLGAVPR